MTDSRADIGAPHPARRGMADHDPPRFAWHVQCLDCRAAGIYYHAAQAAEWADNHHCPPKDAA